MRIAFSGTHYSGKSTLVQAFAIEKPEYEVYDEPYWILTELGRHFSSPPTIDEFEEQLECALNLLEQSSSDALFDRCPVDFLAYALAVAEQNGQEFNSEQWESRIAEGMAFLDLVVFLPLQNPDPIPIPRSEDMDLRQLVDEKLRQFLIEDTHEIIRVPVIEVQGSVDERVKKTKEHLKLMR